MPGALGAIALGRALYVHYGLDPDDYETNIFIDEGTAWFKSEACIRMGLALGPPWSWARWFRIVPRSVRDAGYEIVARNRMRFMGRRNVCYVADAAHRARSLG
jgi:predicted DCC family thiol-disulfide oxidoreductase YuxK